MDGKLSVLPGERPTASDWWDHLSTAFPEVRLKSFLEMRGADGGPWSRICALPAFWVGLLYDQGALDAAWDLVKDWSMEEREQLRNDAPRLALNAPLPGGKGTMQDLGREALAIAHAGLAARGKLNASGDNETGYLETLDEIVKSGKVIAMRGSDGTVSLEPAGQLELSGAPLETLHETCAETGRHLAQVKEIGERCGVGYLGLGMWPDKTREELPVMPKGRYKIMMNHMPKVGNLGLDMMLRTCTIQVNLDYSSEADMVQKFRVGLAMQPLATALFAISGFT
jgi:gamma-glutamylcysteine synthetase